MCENTADLLTYMATKTMLSIGPTWEREGKGLAHVFEQRERVLFPL